MNSKFLLTSLFLYLPFILSPVSASGPTLLTTTSLRFHQSELCHGSKKVLGYDPLHLTAPKCYENTNDKSKIYCQNFISSGQEPLAIQTFAVYSDNSRKSIKIVCGFEDVSNANTLTQGGFYQHHKLPVPPQLRPLVSDSNSENSCQPHEQACPLPSGHLECLDRYELTACRNCKMDCTALPGVAGVGCDALGCLAFSCKPGYFLSGRKCVLKSMKRQRKMIR